MHDTTPGGSVSEGELETPGDVAGGVASGVWRGRGVVVGRVELGGVEEWVGGGEVGTGDEIGERNGAGKSQRISVCAEMARVAMREARGRPCMCAG